MQEKNKIKIKEVTFKEPSLSLEEKLYLKAYLATLSHNKAYRIVNPNAKESTSFSKNKYSRSPGVQYYINKELINRTAALNITPEILISKMYEEATFHGKNATPSARIAALQILGKQIGIFKEKEESKENITYNIINYKTDDNIVPKKIEEERGKEVDVKEKGFSNITIKKYDN